MSLKAVVLCASRLGFNFISFVTVSPILAPDSRVPAAAYSNLLRGYAGPVSLFQGPQARGLSRWRFKVSESPYGPIPRSADSPLSSKLSKFLAAAALLSSGSASSVALGGRIPAAAFTSCTSLPRSLRASVPVPVGLLLVPLGPIPRLVGSAHGPSHVHWQRLLPGPQSRPPAAGVWLFAIVVLYRASPTLSDATFGCL